MSEKDLEKVSNLITHVENGVIIDENNVNQNEENLH
jgi:hypothetical protein